MGDEVKPVENQKPEGDGSVKEDGKGPIPYERFKQVNDALATYKELGSVDELRQLAEDYSLMIDALSQQSQQAQQAQKQESVKKAEGKIPEAKRAQLVAELEELIPGISKLSELVDKVGSVEKTQANLGSQQLVRLQESASGLVAELVSGAGYPAELAEFVENAVANVVYADPTLRGRFLSGDLSVVESVFKTVDDTYLRKHVLKPKKDIKSAQLPGMLSRVAGLARQKAVQGATSEEDLKKLSHQERMKVVGKEAFDLYNSLIAERQAAGLLEGE